MKASTMYFLLYYGPKQVTWPLPESEWEGFPECLTHNGVIIATIYYTIVAG